MSLISEESKKLIQDYARAKLMKDSMGAALYGQDLREWPAYVVDAFTIIHGEHQAVESKKILMDSGPGE